MIGADVALAALLNRAANAYTSAPPAYMTYREQTHVVGGNRSEDIDRAAMVRVADNYAIMQDLPKGAVRIGPAFPIIPFFDPISNFSYSYYANFKKIDITFNPGQPFLFPMPQPDPSVDMVVTYMSFWAPRYAPDSTPDALHVLVDPTPRTGNSFYPSEVREDATTMLPSSMVMKDNSSDIVLTLDYAVIEGHWVITHGSWSGSQRVMGFTFKVNADVTYTDFTFPAQPPDPRLAGTPRPSASASPSPAATASP